MQTEIEFMDGFKVQLGDRVKFDCATGTKGTGVVIGFGRGTVKVEPDAGTVFGPMDRWALNPEAAKAAGVTHFVKCRDHGIPGGGLVR